MTRAAIRSIESIVCFGNVQFTTAALTRCAAEGIDVSWLSRGGRFRAGLRSPVAGNVLLRVEQYVAARDRARSLDISRAMVAAKLLNSRVVLLDAAKDNPRLSERLRLAAGELANLAEQTRTVADADTLRGLEGFGAKRYFGEWTGILRPSGFEFSGRMRRPPTDPINALLSFSYGLLRVRCASAAEHVGLDPQMGFLHPARPGRPSLALDLMEELRAPFADRLVLTLVNRRQLTERAFTKLPTGEVRLDDDARAQFLAAFDAHMTAEVPHRAVEPPIERRKVAGLQALLLARHLRGDLSHYLPYRTTGR